jgi:PAS domain S-box-containing protein
MVLASNGLRRRIGCTTLASVGAEGTRILVIPVIPEGETKLAPLRDWIAQQEGNEGVRIEHAMSVADAATRLRARRFDAILCELAPDGEAGLDLLREVRARGDLTTFALIVEEEVQEAVARRAGLLGRAPCLVRETLSVEQVSDALGTGPSGEQALGPRTVDLVPTMIWKTNPEGQFTHFSRRWCLFTGRSEEKERGVGWLDGVHPADVDTWIKLYSSALASSQEFKIDIRLRAADGDFRWVRCHGIPGFSADGCFTGYLGSSFDVTDLEQAHQEVVARLERLTQRSC